MGQASNARGRVRNSRLALAVALSLLVSSAALAADEASNNGAMRFPNVSVINAPQAAQSQTSAGQGGMRAYKDSATSPLRGPTTEEMAAASASRSSAVNARRLSASDGSASPDAPSFAAAGGGVGVMLDDSSLQYSVVVRQADGALSEICVTGADAADEVVRKSPVLKTAAQKESTNVR
ncbi:MAG: hypothetical protein ABI277_16880 [Burkholderiaceae bacterium]